MSRASRRRSRPARPRWREAALIEAQARGLVRSLDLNYRANLWRYGRSAPEVMRDLVALADLVIANEEDCQKALGIEASADVTAGPLATGTYEELSAEVLRQFPHLRAVAITLRESRGADVNGWSACLRDADGFHAGRSFEILDIVDRVGDRGRLRGRPHPRLAGGHAGRRGPGLRHRRGMPEALGARRLQPRQPGRGAAPRGGRRLGPRASLNGGSLRDGAGIIARLTVRDVASTEGDAP